MICLRSLRCYALNCIHIWEFCKGLMLMFRGFGCLWAAHKA
ncbi:hypothetical protein HMPREF9371_1167 [Neisseria shayeganii 871]|uniref:Uncharacterized protein n=1 Tax=Neisseria shayeganii 871 TaxID=1032488 RepID=G4CHS8_9NEIS|nr:hypothetical protein HMPREF9371_1167 [Neisseria shayeganii 871]